MSKRKYRSLPLFYDYKFIPQNDDPHTYWFGVRIRVLESKIPFVEYLTYSWNHVRILDLSACNVDDEIWQRFLQNSNHFTELMYIDVSRNNITTVKKADLEKFPRLVRFLINRNRLTH